MPGPQSGSEPKTGSRAQALLPLCAIQAPGYFHVWYYAGWRREGHYRIRKFWNLNTASYIEHLVKYILLLALKL